MRRAWLAALGCVALSSLSCGVNTVEPPMEEQAFVSAAPPLAVAEPEPDATEALAEPPSEDARLEPLIAFLEVQPTGLTGVELHDLAAAIIESVSREQLDLRLILALMYVESRYRPFAVSPVGAMGLMQILPATGEEVAGKLGITWYGPETLFDPVVNVRIGIAYVKELTNRYEKISTALAAYNWGMGTIDKRLRRGSPLPRVYPGLVMDAYSHAVLQVTS